MDLYVVAVCFPVIFIGELPDKTMFANLLLASRGHPGRVWLGAASAFAVHATIAVTVGVALFEVLPRRAVDATVAALFLAGAAYAWWEGAREPDRPVAGTVPRRGTTITAFVVIFLAEWGDLTQILTANLAARYHSAPSVGLAAVLGLWAAAGVAVFGGAALTRLIDVRTIRRLTAAILVVLAALSVGAAAR
jgi:putative Ca2+/H+ antiporter (TMEM165/GDT1 family)